jgi:hypothetical protein
MDTIHHLQVVSGTNCPVLSAQEMTLRRGFERLAVDGARSDVDNPGEEFQSTSCVPICLMAR